MICLEIFKLFGRILINSDDADKSMQKTESKAKNLLSVFGNGIKTAAKWGAGIAAGAATAAAAAIGAFLKVDEATKEYRENMAKLNTAWEASGGGAKLAKQAYEGLYSVLGDQDAATEASQLLAQLASDTEGVANWTDIAAGVVGTFGDALPVNSLIEAANETAKVGTVTGALADALNWVGISEDEFNEKLAACSSEQERNRLITETLSQTYAGATEAFKANNEQTLKAREAQAALDAAMGKLGGAVEKVKTGLMSEFTPAISDVVSAFADFMEGAEGADVALQQSIQNMIDKIVLSLPQFLDFGIDLIVQIATGIIKNLPYLLKQIPKLIGEVTRAFLQLGSELYTVGKELFSQLFGGLKDVWANVSSWVNEKVNWLGDKLAFWKKGQSEMDGGGGRSNAHASGLSYVPYDGYPATLHRGETVLNAHEAEAYRNLVAGTVQQELPPITIVVQSVLDGKILGEKVTKYQEQKRRSRG